MASTGSGAWIKYYQGKGDVQTTTKVAGYALDSNGTPSNTLIEAGTPVLVLATTEYETKPEIKLKINGRLKTVRFKFADLTKPNSKASAAVSLKPQAFNLVDAKINITTYKSRLKASIEARDDLNGELRSYLLLLVDYWSGVDAAKAKITKLFPEIKDRVPVNDINKDFGEVLGPLACIKRAALSKAKAKITPSSTIWIPSRPNEPLMDYMVDDYVISAKSGATTNTVKSVDIINLLAKRPAMMTKYKNTKEFKILKMLSAESTIEGPISALTAYLGPIKFASFIKDNTYLKSKKGKYTKNELMYECEKALQTASKSGTLNFTAMFADAIKGNVIYVKFEIDSTGVGVFETIIAEDLIKTSTGTRPYLRTKNGYTRASDKMGIQI